MARAALNGVEIDYEVTGRGPAVLLCAGHASNLDRPATFNRVLLDFLDALPPPIRPGGSAP